MMNSPIFMSGNSRTSSGSWTGGWASMRSRGNGGSISEGKPYRMQKTAIEWVRNPDGSQGYSWNPVKGICPMDCKTPNGKSYCYARKNYIRFRRLPMIVFSLIECAKPFHLKKPLGIFVCSTFEIFHPEVTERQRDLIFATIRNCPQHRFYILTKLPQNIDRPMPPNVWLGITLEGPQNILLKMHHFYQNLNMTPMIINFISFEPLLREIQFIPIVDWVIVGRLTGHGHKYDPKKEWIEQMIKQAQAMRTPIFLKNNLIPILSEQFVKTNQEFPKEQP